MRCSTNFILFLLDTLLKTDLFVSMIHAFHNNVYEKVYTDEKDAVLFWKTHMLHYVKTESLYNSMPVEFDA